MSGKGLEDPDWSMKRSYEDITYWIDHMERLDIGSMKRSQGEIIYWIDQEIDHMEALQIGSIKRWIIQRHYILDRSYGEIKYWMDQEIIQIIYWIDEEIDYMETLQIGSIGDNVERLHTYIYVLREDQFAMAFMYISYIC